MLSTETQTFELDVAPAIVFDILADPRRIPEWVPAFADRVSEDPPQGWQVIKGDDRFAIRMVAFPQSGTVDYLRQIAPGREGGAYIRDLPKSTGGSVVVMTLPVPPGTDSERVRAILRDELAALGALARAADRLANRFEVSQAMMQRNLAAFDQKRLKHSNANGETYSSQSRFVQARRENEIAQLALNYIAEGLTILLDAGSTTLSLARALRGNFQSLCIITNSIPAALELSKTKYQILLTGGEVGDSNLALIGSAATKTLKRYHADRAFLGTSGITVAHGCSTADPLEAQVKQAMIRSADETYVLADSSKFGHAYLESFASLSAISLTLTDSGMPGIFREAFAERGIGFKCP